MARIRLKGLNSRRKALADGSVVTYYYAWKGGPRLAGELGSPEFIASYHEAVTAKKAAPMGVLLSLMQAYQGSAEFAGLRDRTRLDYVKQIRLIEGQFGDFPLAALGSRGTRVPIPVKPPVCNGMIAPRDSWMMPPPCNEMIPPGAPRLLAERVSSPCGVAGQAVLDCLPRVRRRLSPVNSMRCALWTRRSRMASA
jgi:hypothetical protein